MQENGGCESGQAVAARMTATAADHLLTESSVPLCQICHVCGRVMLGLVRQGYLCQSMIIDRINEGGNAITSIHPSVCLFPLCLWN